jgi:hypothetical protein
VIKIFGEYYSCCTLSFVLSAVASFIFGLFVNYKIGSLWLAANIVLGLAIVLYKMENKNDSAC